MKIEKKYQEYIDKGYRVVSRKHGIISRIDREDWKEVMAAGHPSGMSWVKGLGVGANDWYRRCLSKDTIEFGENSDVVKFMPNSNNDAVGFIPQLSSTEKIYSDTDQGIEEFLNNAIDEI